MGVDTGPSGEEPPEEWRRQWGALHSDPPVTLHHYTTAHGLQGIIESQSLRASHASYLNDATELVYARSVFERVLERAVTTVASDAARKLAQGWRDLLSSAIPESEVYVTCFCEKQDLLSQWRGYAGSTGGYSIAFYTPSWLDRTRPPVVLRRVIYDEDAQDEWVRSLVEPMMEHVDGLAGELGEAAASEHVSMVLRRCLDDTAECFFCFKHPAFQEEQEWRIAYRPTTTTAGEAAATRRFRARDNLIVPYVDLDVRSGHPSYQGRLPVPLVMVGPAALPDLATKSVVMLLRDHGYTDTDVQTSLVPLRGRW